jgi:hypothetical protein
LQLLKRFGCGCIGISLDDGKQIIFKACYGDDDHPALHINGPAELMKPESLPGKFITEENQEAIFDEINRLMTLGRRFEIIQRVLGIEVKP